MAIPNALITFVIATLLNQGALDGFLPETHPFSELPLASDVLTARAQALLAGFSGVMIFVLNNRSNTAYDRWWEGGTLLQKTRGEWFNAYSSVMAFTSTKPELDGEVSPNRSRAFEIFDGAGIDQKSLDFLNRAPDKVEVILQWIQRSMILHAQTGVLCAPPPILSRAFQEVSRGIVNLQNARKIADFPYPYPLAQVSMILLLFHWFVQPFIAAFAFSRGWATAVSFVTIFVLWCIHFNALDLEFPFGERVNDIPMADMQRDWNKSLSTLLARRAQAPPEFKYVPAEHRCLKVVMSDGSKLPEPPLHPGPLARRSTVEGFKLSDEVDRKSSKRSSSKDDRVTAVDDAAFAQGAPDDPGEAEPMSPLSQDPHLAQVIEMDAEEASKREAVVKAPEAFHLQLPPTAKEASKREPVVKAPEAFHLQLPPSAKESDDSVTIGPEAWDDNALEKASASLRGRSTRDSCAPDVPPAQLTPRSQSTLPLQYSSAPDEDEGRARRGHGGRRCRNCGPGCDAGGLVIL